MATNNIPEPKTITKAIPRPDKAARSWGSDALDRDILQDVRGVISDSAIQIARSRINGTFKRPYPYPTPEWAEVANNDQMSRGISQTKDRLVNGPLYDQVIPANSSLNNRPSNENSLYIVNLVSLETIEIPFVPQKLEYTPSSNWVSIQAVARNNPLYHYTGGEDILKFQIDWFTKNEDRKDVITNCKKIEALSRNDGYNNPPPYIRLLWNNILFGNATWIVDSAPYSLEFFNKQYSMLPQQAYQEVTLRRVTEYNRTTSQILDISW